jgi:hypothetical protein
MFTVSCPERALHKKTDYIKLSQKDYSNVAYKNKKNSEENVLFAV